MASGLRTKAKSPDAKKDVDIKVEKVGKRSGKSVTKSDLVATVLFKN